MNIIFYKLQDEVNDVKKTRTLTATSTYTPLTVVGKLRSSASKVTPTIDFGQDITYFSDYNYAYIADFGRYYFVDDMISVRESLTSISFRVDVLTSFLTQSNITGIEGYVGRTSNPTYYDLNTPDSKIQFKIKPQVVVETPASYTSNIENITFNVNALANILITLDDTRALSASYAVQDPDLYDIEIPLDLRGLVNQTSISSQSFRPQGSVQLYVTDIIENEYGTYDNVGGVYWYKIGLVMDYCRKHQDVATFVNSIIAYPFTLPRTQTKSTFYINGNTIKVSDVDITMYKGTKNNSGYLVLKDFILNESSLSPNDFDNYSKYEPFAKCEIFIPFVGWTNIDIKNNLGNRLMVIYNVNYTTGQATAFLYNKTKNEILYQSSCMIGIQMPYNATNMRENELKDQNYVRNLLTGLATSGVSMVAGAVTYNPYLIAGGIAGMATATTQFINNENLLLDKQTNKGVSTSPNSGVLTGLKVLIKWTKLESVNFYDQTSRDNFISHLGLPCNKLLNLSSIPVSGDYHTYCEVVDLHTTTEAGTLSIKDITYSETQELKKLCAEGIYL